VSALTTARPCGSFKHLQYSEVLGWISNPVPTTRATTEILHSTDKIDGIEEFVLHKLVVSDKFTHL
jgi:hypothetical protein